MHRMIPPGRLRGGQKGSNCSRPLLSERLATGSSSRCQVTRRMGYGIFPGFFQLMTAVVHQNRAACNERVAGEKWTGLGDEWAMAPWYTPSIAVGRRPAWWIADAAKRF